MRDISGNFLRDPGNGLLCTMRRFSLALVIGGSFAASGSDARPIDQLRAQSWPGYQVIMWHPKTSKQYAALRALGVTAATVPADRNGETAATATRKSLSVVTAGLRLYVENIATDFYSAYHRWFAGRAVNWKYLALKTELAANASDPDVVVREPSLSDQSQLEEIGSRLATTVHAYARFDPLFFNLADEAGIADLSAAWDFDFAPASLSGMRVWLKGRYHTLDALNQEWETQFRSWDAVMPSTTTDAMNSPNDNFASWSDFKKWMDVAFSRSVRFGTESVQSAAPWARSAIEGAQKPGWGGYDYSLLAPSVDVMEVYDDGSNLELAQSFNPNLVILASPNWRKPDAQYRAWNEFLRGSRGMVLWDPDDEFITPTGDLGVQGTVAAPFLQEMRDGIGPLLTAARRKTDPIALVYSPESFRVQWMLDHRAMGSAWTTRSASDENEDNADRSTRRRALELLRSLGYEPNFVSEEQIAGGLLRKAQYKMLLLPNTIALSPRAAVEIRDFVGSDGTLAADGEPGLFDEHGKKLSSALLSDVFANSGDHAIKLSSNDSDAASQLTDLAHRSGLAPEVTISSGAGVRVPEVGQYTFKRDGITFVALLAQPASSSPDQSKSVEVELPSDSFVYDVHSGKLLGHTNKLLVDVKSSFPTVLALVASHLSSSG